MEVNYASRGVGNTALGLSIGALAAELLGGTFNGIIGNGAKCADTDKAVNRYELEMQKQLIDRDAEIAFLKGRDAAKTDNLEMYRYFDGRINRVENELADQRVYNATNTAALGCINNQVNQIMSLFQLKIPNSSVCPGWGSATVTVTPATTGA